MAYRESPPPRLLRGLVECGWMAGIAADEPPQLLTVVPDGCMDLIWTGTELLVAGPDTAPHPYRRDPGMTAAGLRFAPGRLPALLDVPAALLRDRRVPLAELHPALARRGTARVEHGAAPTTVLVDLALALPGPPPDPGVAAVAAHVGAAASVTATADALGWTSRTLHRRCLAAFGYGPAVLRRVLRFRRALALLRAGTPAAEAAVAAGYADQPHLSREVRALAGVAPGQLVSGANRSTPLPSGSCTTA
ncbi:MAG: helix-turn-helix domain-containing protein [Pseudonocardia sp.]